MGVAIAVPIGPRGGAGQFPGQDEIVGRDVISEVKGRDLMVDRFSELFGLCGIHGLVTDRPQSKFLLSRLTPEEVQR